ncbi:MAG: RluA family pseudouridine synthase [Solobacterium sp.]|nr:RluA family pseudouridine synthase [Solobacterium sp.]
METLELIAEASGVRIDKYLSEVTDLSRSRVQTLCEEGKILADGTPAKSSLKVTEGMRIIAEIPEDEPLDVKAEDIPLDILYEDADIIVVNKPKGMVVHPAAGVYSGTLVNALLFHCKDLSGINGVLRPGIVHRIDKDTTGCIVACKNDLAHNAIAEQLKDKTCHREYLALCDGVIEHEQGEINAPIGRDPKERKRMTVIDKNSKEARTFFTVKERFANHTLVDCRLETGRTHQIRVHMKYIHHPVTGDPVYGTSCRYMDTQGQVLHACQLSLVHPRTHEAMTFTAPLPAYFEELLEILRNEEHIED